MPDRPLMLKVKLSFIYSIHPQSNEVVLGVMIKATGLTQNLMTALNQKKFKRRVSLLTCDSEWVWLLVENCVVNLNFLSCHSTGLCRSNLHKQPDIMHKNNIRFHLGIFGELLLGLHMKITNCTYWKNKAPPHKFLS